MIKVGIIGGTGYTGVELMRILCGHPAVSVELITSRGENGKAVADLFPSLRGTVDLCFSDPDTAPMSSCDVVFSATPNGVAMTHAPSLLDAGVKLIDLGADFRLQDADTWERWYGMSHSCPDLLAEAVYGLPELNREAIRQSRLVANPGCYPTSVSLGAIPLVKAGLVHLSDIVADAKSGVSGAGRGASIATLFCEAADSLKAYGVQGHRHLPEIRQTLDAAAGAPIGLTFVPHLTPMLRGIHATLYFKARDVDQDLTELYREHYRGEPFVDVMDPGAHPDTRSVRASNCCRIAVHRLPEDRIVVLSVIDNLVKGAAGQAVQNMNLMFGIDETSGLNHTPIVP